MPTQYRLAYTMSGPSEDTEDMYLAEAPALPGCRAWGETPELALEYLASVAEGFIRSYLKDSEPVPSDIIDVGVINVPLPTRV